MWRTNVRTIEDVLSGSGGGGETVKRNLVRQKYSLSLKMLADRTMNIVSDFSTMNDYIGDA